MNPFRSLERLQNLIQIIPPLLYDIPDEDFNSQPNTGKWSKKQILGHLVDSASNNHQRFIRIQYESEPTIYYDQDKWNFYNHHQDLTKKHLIEFWRIYNQHLIQLALNISEENLEKTGKSKDGIARTLAWYIQDYVVHMEHHLRQIVDY